MHDKAGIILRRLSGTAHGASLADQTLPFLGEVNTASVSLSPASLTHEVFNLLEVQD